MLAASIFGVIACEALSSNTASPLATSVSCREFPLDVILHPRINMQPALRRWQSIIDRKN
jgi:hypothetical protein